MNNLTDQTILVTGACGFTGSNMLEYLSEVAPEAQLVATDLDGSTRGEYYVESKGNNPEPVYFEDVLEENDVEFYPADLTDAESIEAVIEKYEYDVVFHIASLFDYFAPWDTLYEVNVRGTYNLYNALSNQASPPRIIHWSTLGVLGHAGFERPKVEEDTQSPHNRYCYSKQLQEKVVEDIFSELGATIIRPAPIYGPRHRYGVYHILTLVNRMGIAPVSKIYPRSKQLQFPSVHVADVVGAATHLATTDDAQGEAYNVLSNCIPQDDLLDFLAKEFDCTYLPIPMPHQLYNRLGPTLYRVAKTLSQIEEKRGARPLIDAPMIRYLTYNMWFSNEKIKKTGFEFRYENPKDGLRAYIKWCREQGDFE